jgi:hypothetical protein
MDFSFLQAFYLPLPTYYSSEKYRGSHDSFFSQIFPCKLCKTLSCIFDNEQMFLLSVNSQNIRDTCTGNPSITSCA